MDGAPSCAAKWAALIDRWYETRRLSRSMSVNLRLTSYRSKKFRSMPSRVTHGYIRGWQIDVGSPSNRIRPGYGEPGTPDTYVLAEWHRRRHRASIARPAGEPQQKQRRIRFQILLLFEVEPRTRPALVTSLSESLAVLTGLRIPSSSR